MKTEIELKFYPIDKDKMRQKLRAAGFTLVSPEFMMTRAVFHNPHLKDRWGRVRQEPDNVTMSIKRVKDYTLLGTEEAELVVDSFEAASAFMEDAGFLKTSFQESMREIWRKGNVEADIDHWPGLLPWVEIESDSEDAVHKTCAELGFDEEDAMYGSSDFVYEKYLGIPRNEINTMPQITFANPPQKYLKR